MFFLLKLMLITFSVYENSPRNSPFFRHKLSSLVGECHTLLVYMFYVHPTKMLVLWHRDIVLFRTVPGACRHSIKIGRAHV